jgi:hypothetical protein
LRLGREPRLVSCGTNKKEFLFVAGVPSKEFVLFSYRQLPETCSSFVGGDSVISTSPSTHETNAFKNLMHPLNHDEISLIIFESTRMVILYLMVISVRFTLPRADPPVPCLLYIIFMYRVNAVLLHMHA